MKKIYIKTTETCQLQCSHCYIGDNRKKLEFFNEDQTIVWLKDYFEKVQDDEAVISFHGGEPFLCPTHKIKKVIDAFPKYEFDATSNLCFKITEDIEDIILNHFKYNGSPFIKTSWDYKIRFKNDKQLKLWEDNVKYLISKGVRVKINICLTSFLVKEVNTKDLIKYLLEGLGIRDINFERLTDNTTSDKSLIPDYDEQDNWLRDFYNNNRKLCIDNAVDIYHATNGDHINCRKRQCMSDVITINANGSVGGCPNSATTNPYTDIYTPYDYNNEKLQELIRVEKTKRPECYYCDLYTVCNGDCHQLSWQGNKCPAPKKFMRRVMHVVEREKKTGLFNV